MIDAYVPYTLTTRGALNAKSKRKAFQGALVRHHGGYGCVHPWPELGDGSLEEEIRALFSGRDDTRLSAATRRCLRLDGEARRTRQSLFDGLEVPPSHATLTEACFEDLEASETADFFAIKLKASPDRLEPIAALLASTPLPLRLDFNGSLSPEALLAWHGSLSELSRNAIDFIEDPVPYDPLIWTQLEQATGWRFAVDAAQDEATTGFHLRVLKPAVEDLTDFDPGEQSFLVTSYMDHPLGQLYAAYEAARLAKAHPRQITICGLATHRLFEDLPKELDLGGGPQLTLPGGTGLGLDAYLEGLAWQPLPV